MDLDNEKAMSKAKSYKKELYESRLTPDLSPERRALIKDYIDTGMELTLHLYLEQIVPLSNRVRSIERFMKTVVKYGGIFILFIFGAIGTAIFKLILKG